MSLRTPLSTLFMAPLLLAACGGDPPPHGTGGSGGTAGTGGSAPQVPALSITWSDCNLFTEGPTVPAKCGKASAPLRWDDPQGASIELFVKRLPASGTRRGSLWLLDGGPGGGGVGPEGIAYLLSMRDAGLDIYIPHHRGTGQSTKLTCAGGDLSSPGGLQITAAEWPACIDELTKTWGDGLAAFNTTEAARDLHGLVAVEKKDGDEVVVMGSSYGTYLANRYLALDPTQATAVILDSICPPDACHLDQFDVLYDQVGHQLLSLCAAEPACTAEVGADPKQALVDLYDAVDAGHCPALSTQGLDRRTLRTVLAVMLDDINFRRGIPAVIKRYQRCDPGDVDAIGHLLQSLFGKPGDPPSAFLKAWSFPLSNNITFSELWTDPPPPVDALAAAADATLISEGVTFDSVGVFPLWPRYPRDGYFGKWGDNTLPMLMMNGDLDPATPITIASAAGDHFKGPHQTFVTMPRSPHNALVGGPIDHMGGSCGVELTVQFLADPMKPLDTSCLQAVLPLSFMENPTLAQLLFGVDSLYENG